MQATWKDYDFSACTRRMRWYPEFAVEEKPICRGSGPRAELSFSICRFHVRGLESDWVQIKVLPIISCGTLSKALNLWVSFSLGNRRACLLWCLGTNAAMLATLTFTPSALETFSLQRLLKEKAKTLSLILKPRIGTGVYVVLSCRVEAGTNVQVIFFVTRGGFLDSFLGNSPSD